MMVYIGSFFTETNTFSPVPTGMSAFLESKIVRDASSTSEVMASQQMRTFRDCAERAGYSVTEGISAFAQPGGITVKETFEFIRELILNDIAKNPHFDIVLLALHGAMIADGYDDCEGNLLSEIRALLPNAVIGAVLDPHCHLTQAMLEAADILITAKEYPHVDFADRARELFDICHRTATGTVTPTHATIDTEMIGVYPTLSSPMAGIVSMLRSIESKPGVLSASIVHGFPWGDVADVGTRVLVYTDGNVQMAREYALDVARPLYAKRFELLPDYPTIDEALDRAILQDGLVILADNGDNPGGGAPGDSTFFIRALIERNIVGAVIGCIFDPAVVNVCADVGVGGHLSVRLGGKTGPTSGDPVDLAVEVKAIIENHSQTVFGGRRSVGRTVWLRHQQIDILVNSIRVQTFSSDMFTGCGLSMDDKKVVIVKSSRHFEAGFRDISEHLWVVGSPGTLTIDFANLPYTKRNSHFFPRIDDPWAGSGMLADRA